jgi:hypothetical protein
MLRFYQRPAWLNVLRLFANIDNNQEMVAKLTATTMRQLAYDGFAQKHVDS